MDKATLRKTYLEKRLTLTNEEYENRNIVLVEKLFNSIDFSKVIFVHIFLPITKFKEVNTWLIIKQLKRNHPTINIIVPKVVGEDLIHIQLVSNEQLAQNKWGIDEPVYGIEVTPQDLDIVFVPLIIADKQGNRIGYGKGFYDRFLIQCKPTCQTIGLSLLPLLECLDCTNASDVPLDTVITA